MAYYKTKDEMVKDVLNIEWNSYDFFMAYCAAKGIDDPESDIDEEEYTKLEEECDNAITYKMLADLRDAIIEDTNERIAKLMAKVAR